MRVSISDGVSRWRETGARGASVPRRLNARYVRYHTLRKHRRRYGVVWAVIAAVALLGAWDVESRIDEVAYTASPRR